MARNHGRLSSKKVLVTGGTTGIGLEIAQRFIAEGARVALTGRNPETLAEAKSTVPEAMVIASDAGRIDDQKALAARLKQEFGEVDAVVVNAGIGVFQPLEGWDEASFDRQMDTNFKGPFFLLQALAPHLSNSASIVLIASIAAHIGMAQQSVYAASKAALLTLMRNLPFEMNGRNVRVNSISPGPITTPIFGKLGLTAEAAEQFRKDVATKVPMGRFGTTREIADAAVFLASDESSYMLGSEIVIDGGLSRL
jgi:NAD(P)-dependent dehydrogenase (short-subunit alcohol dehydrogenase family)